MQQNNGTFVGEVNCLNCGRTLGEALRSADTGRLRLRPAAHQPEPLVELVDRHTLRCRHCLGRAFIEPVLSRDVAPEAAAAGSTRSVAGAA